MLKPLRIAVQFLTRIPVPSPGIAADEDTGRSLLWYPLVGAIVGAILWTLYTLTGGVSPLLRAALILAVWVLITGALHLDGLADSADAWLGGLGNRERTLAIMKDPCSGPGAVTTLIIVLMLKLAALDAVVASAQWTPLILAPLLGRTALPLLLLTTPYVRSSGLGAVLATHFPRRSTAIILVSVAVIMSLIFGRSAMVMLIASLGLFWMMRRLMIRRLGGTTGDTAGAVVEIVELTVLLTACLKLHTASG